LTHRMFARAVKYAHDQNSFWKRSNNVNPAQIPFYH